MTHAPEPDPTGADPAPTGSRAPRGRRRRWTKLVVPLVSVLVLALAGLVIYGYNIERRITQNITRGIDLNGDDESGSATPRPTKEAQETGTLNYVLLGSDSRDVDDDSNGRSDTIMVAHLNAERDKAYIMSFPRDMYVDIPGYGKNKINAAFAFGGPALTVKTLEQLTGVRMDHVVLVDFDGFHQLTEDLGGVTVTNKTAFSSHGHTYPKGRITISGAEALWFVRERYALPGGDLDRAENQRNVIKALVQKGLSAETVSDPAKFTTFIGNAAKHLTVDNSLTDAEIRRTALSLRMTGKDIVLLQAPLAGFGTAPDGGSIDLVDTAKMAELSTALKNDDVAGYVKKYPKG